MPDPVWPVSLPKPLREGYGVSGELSVERTEMESGPARVIRTSTVNRKSVNAALTLDATQLATFWDFFNDEANGGADFFLVPLKVAGSVTNRRCRFASFPSEGLVSGTHTQVTFQLENYEAMV